MHIFEFPSRSLRHIWGELLGSPFGIELLGALIGESFNHKLNVLRHVTCVKAMRYKSRGKVITLFFDGVRGIVNKLM